MYNQPFYMPGYYSSAMPNLASRAIPNMTRGAMSNLARGAMMPGAAMNTAMGTAGAVSRGGLFGKLGSAFGAIRSFNWGGLINNTSKTLGIINQTIPLVRQVGPMVGNMRSMLRLASVFKDETDTKVSPKQNNVNHSQKQNVNLNQDINSRSSNNNNNEQVNYEKKEDEHVTYGSTDGSPTFFVN